MHEIRKYCQRPSTYDRRNFRRPFHFSKLNDGGNFCRLFASVSKMTVEISAGVFASVSKVTVEISAGIFASVSKMTVEISAGFLLQ